MSRVPRSVEDGQFDTQTGNTDSKNESMDMQVILDQLDRLTIPEEESTSKESLPARWKKDNVQRVLDRIKATTTDMLHFLNNPQTIRLLSPDVSPEQRQRDYVATKGRPANLRVAIQMSNNDVQELSDAYLPGVDSDALKTAIRDLKKQVQTLEDICNRF